MGYTSERAPGMEHFPKYPTGFIAVRILQLILSLICLGLSAYTVAVATLDGNCLMLFIALVTTIVMIWEVSAMSCAKRAYNYWAVLTFDIFCWIFWLVSFALTAVWAAFFLAYGAVDSYYDSYDDYSFDYYGYYGLDDDMALTYGAILAASAGLGALNYLLFFISLIIQSCVIHRHRRAGLHSRPVKNGTGAPAAGQPYQMTPQSNPNYAAVPQQGMPFHQQDTAYNPQGVYAPQQQQGYPPQGYPQQQPQQQQGYYAPQPQPQQGYYPPQATSPAPSHPTDASFNKPVSPQPPQGAYQAPYQPPYQQQ